MTKMMTCLEDKMGPIAQFLDENRYLSAIKNAFIAIMPLLIVGSFFILFAYLPIEVYTSGMESLFGPSWQNLLLAPYNITMNAMTLYLVIVMASQLAKAYQLDKMGASFAALASFLLVTPLYPLADDSLGQGVAFNNLGVNGLFVGIIVSLLAVEILRFVDQRGWKIKMPAAVPANVAVSFSTLIPILVVIIIFNLIRIGFESTSYGSLQAFIFSNLQTPLTALGATLPATVLLMLLEGLLWFFGINGGNIVGGVMQPIWLALTAENAEAFASGLPIPNIVNFQFYASFIKIGGSGATLGLCLLLLFFAKSSQFKAIGKLSLAPQLFNINETVIFGVPILLNPLLFVPFILTPIVTAVVAYFAMNWGLVPLTNGVNIPWTTPPVISGFLLSGWRGALLNIVQLLISMGVYYPFFKAADNLAYQKELGNETTEV